MARITTHFELEISNTRNGILFRAVVVADERGTRVFVVDNQKNLATNIKQHRANYPISLPVLSIARL